MKIPYPLQCTKCGNNEVVVRDADSFRAEFKCTSCGEENTLFFRSTIKIQQKLLLRSAHEINETEDYSISIILSALAAECEMSRLYKKWRELIEIKNKKELVDPNLVENEYRKLGGFQDKLNKMTRLATKNDFDFFVSSNPELLHRIHKIFPDIGQKMFIEVFDQYLFWKRNKILHQGKTDCSKNDAIQCHNVARLLIEILKKIDDAKLF